MRRVWGRAVRRWLTALAVVGAVALTACSGASDSSTPSGSRTPAGSRSPAGPSTPAGPRLDYVALGDSYSAGPLIPVQRLDPLLCGRSTNNYPAYLAGYLDVATYRDVTCSGATSRDVTSSQGVAGFFVPPQADALSGGTDLVTVGIGGNDQGLFGRLVSTCARLAGGGGGDPCRRHFTTPGGNLAEQSARRLETTVAAALAAVHAAAPGARVLAVGYPQILPAAGTCAAVPFARGDYPWARHVERLLDRSVRRAARTTGSTYVDLWAASRGHDACAGDLAWVRGAQDVTGAAVFHPFRSGEHAFARVVYRVVTGRDAPDDGDAEAAPPAGSVVPNR